MLLLDVNLPGISGLEPLELLRRDPSWHEPLVIMLSANPDQPGIKEAVEQGEVTCFIPNQAERLGSFMEQVEHHEREVTRSSAEIAMLERRRG